MLRRRRRLKAYAELLEARAGTHRQTPAEAREVMSHMLAQADLMSDWVDAMLDVQRLQLGDLPLELTRVDLVQLAWLVAEELQHTTSRHRIRVVATGQPPAPIVADRARLRQVVSNLLENAVKYSAGGTIQVRLGVQNVPGGVSKAIVAMHDEGQGLYLARQIARIPGGDLWAESRGRTNGSTFILALPANG